MKIIYIGREMAGIGGAKAGDFQIVAQRWRAGLLNYKNFPSGDIIHVILRLTPLMTLPNVPPKPGRREMSRILVVTGRQRMGR